MKVVYQSTYALPQPDFSSIALAVKNTNPDVVVGCTYFPDSVGIAQGLSRDGFALKFMAETMVRLKPSSQKRSDRLSPRR